LREVICLVLELREEKRTFVKVGGGIVDFLLVNMVVKAETGNQLRFGDLNCWMGLRVVKDGPSPPS
jgi:hypothetical protein